MTIRIPLWAALVLLLGGLALGRVRAQGAKPQAKAVPQDALGLPHYAYLPDQYSQPYLPSMADWQALRLTAVGAGTTRITDEFSRQQLTCFLGNKNLILTLDLRPEGGWDLFQGSGKFKGSVERVKVDLQKAIAASLRSVRSFFDELQDKDILIAVHIRGERVGIWEGGKLTLAGDPPAEK